MQPTDQAARSHGVAISRDDPVVAPVLLNQIVLRRYLEETVASTADAIREATNDAARHIEQFAEAQATWLKQVTLKDRASQGFPRLTQVTWYSTPASSMRRGPAIGSG